MDPVAILNGVLPPIGIALLLVSFGGARLLSIAAAAGVFVAYALLKAWPAWPHELWAAPNGTEWLLWALVAAALVAVLEYSRRVRGRSAAGLAVAVACVSTWLVLRKVAAQWSLSEAWWYVGSGALIVAVSALGHRAVLRSAPAGVGPAILFTVVLSVDAMVVTLGRSALLGQLCGAVAAALGAAVGTTLWRRPFALEVADGTWLGIAHALFVLAAVHTAYLGWPAAVCALAAPLLLLALHFVSSSSRPHVWMSAGSGLVAVPLVGALVLALCSGDAG